MGGEIRAESLVQGEGPGKGDEIGGCPEGDLVPGVDGLQILDVRAKQACRFLRMGRKEHFSPSMVAVMRCLPIFARG